jgi:hypothetical protein
LTRPGFGQKLIPPLTIGNAAALTVGTATTLIWFYFLLGKWPERPLVSAKMVSGLLLIGIIVLLASLLVEAGIALYVSQVAIFIVIGPVIEELFKAGAVMYSFHRKPFSEYAGPDVGRWAILIGLAVGAFEGMFILYLYQGTPSLVMAAYAVARISPMHAVTTFLAVKGITAKKVPMMFSLVVAAFLIHITNNLIANSVSSIELVGALWAFYVGFLYVVIRRYTVGSAYWASQILTPKNV